ncbi:MAG: hypothetical protein ACYTG6_01545 [Planctomycetota bacterium]|jgi:hypothetical protein
MRSELGDWARPFPTLDRAFDAVERTLARLGVEDPASLRTPRPVEEALSPTALPSGTLLILSPSELRAAEVDIEETVKDERSGGSVFLSLPNERDLENRRRTLRELAVVAPTFAFTPRPTLPPGLSRLRAVPAPEALRGYRFLLADTPGFRVAVVCRALPGGGFVGLWTGNEQAIDEIGTLFRFEAIGAGHDVPEPAPAVPPLEGVGSEKDVWSLAQDLRAYRVVREAELREIARQAALKGVAMRREREAKKRAAG